jgi:hypothetical protein
VSIPDRSKKILVVRPDPGRKYHRGRIGAVFYADGAETNARCSISDWWLEPRTRGPGTHSLLIDGERTDAPRGSYALIPGGVRHDFENHGTDECGFISINAPAGFVQMMPRRAVSCRETLGRCGRCLTCV